MLYYVLLLFALQTSFVVFAASNYQLKNEFAKITEEKKEYIEVKTFKFYKINRNDAAMNITYQTKFDIMKPGEGSIQVTAYQFRNNEYKKTAIKFTIDVCTLLKSGEYDVFKIMTESNLTPCPFLQGTYYVNKISPSMKSLPLSFPQGKWMLEFKFTAHDIVILAIQWMASVEKVIE